MKNTRKPRIRGTDVDTPEYRPDWSKAKPNPYAARLKVTGRCLGPRRG
jgi:hypothetical protein